MPKPPGQLPAILVNPESRAFVAIPIEELKVLVATSRKGHPRCGDAACSLCDLMLRAETDIAYLEAPDA